MNQTVLNNSTVVYNGELSVSVLAKFDKLNNKIKECNNIIDITMSGGKMQCWEELTLKH